MTLITGGAKCGKTVLAMDIVRDFLTQDRPEQHVIVVTESLETWRHAFAPSARLHLHGSLPPHLIQDLDPYLDFIVMDGPVGMDPKVINFSTRGPVLITSSSPTVVSAFQFSSVFTLQLSKVEHFGQTFARLVDDKRNVDFFRIVGDTLISRNYVEPVVKSAWERLLDEDLV